MVEQSRSSLRGIVLDEQVSFTLRELSHACGIQTEVVIEMVDEGVIEPEEAGTEWQFHGDSLVRAQRALRLVRDLDLNWPGAALALDLLDELERLQKHS
jgi:chaperone modulatory protein CbpM